MRYESRFVYKNGKRLFSSNDIDRAFSKKQKIITFLTARFAVLAIKAENGTVRYGTMRYGTGTVTNSEVLLYKEYFNCTD